MILCRLAIFIEAEKLFENIKMPNEPIQESSDYTKELKQIWNDLDWEDKFDYQKTVVERKTYVWSSRKIKDVEEAKEVLKTLDCGGPDYWREAYFYRLEDHCNVLEIVTHWEEKEYENYSDYEPNLSSSAWYRD